MTVLKQSSILFILAVVLFSRLDAEPCRTEGSVLTCQVISESYYQNPNESLESIATLVKDNAGEDIHIDIKIPHVYLTKEIIFTDLGSLTISGDSSSFTIINCTQLDSNAGIMTNDVRNLTLKHLILIHCGSELSIRNKTYSSALTVRSGVYMYITNIVITDSRGTGLMILNHQEGTVHVSRSNFTKNKALHDVEFDGVLGGGGVYIGEFQYNNSSESPISFEFEHCVFEQNVAHTRHYFSFYTDEFGEERTGHGQGGGIFMVFESNITHSQVNVLVSNCKFIQNWAFIGGGLSVKIGRGGKKLTISKITVAIENSLFEFNGCNDSKNTSIGGGIHLSYQLINSTGCEYKLWNVNFTDNCAEFGGGAFFYSDRHNSKNNSLLFESCTFERNKAHMGSAIDMTPSSSMKLSTNLAIVPVFRDCSFLENRVFINLESLKAQRTSAAAGIGTIYASQCDVKFEGENCFENNHGTAVYMVHGIADFSNSSATFDSNRGIRGGAIALLGTSSMIVGPNREYMFCNNSALYQGGAIFKQMIDTHDFTLSRSCFIQYYDYDQLHFSNEWNTSITFHGNSAQVGRAIFTTSLNPCLVVNDNTDSNPYYITVNVSEVFSRRGIEINESEVATEGAKLQSERSQLHVIPGMRTKHGVTIMDDMHSNISEPLRTNIQEIGNAKVKLDSALSLYVGEKIQLKGKPGDQAHLYLQTVSTRQSYTKLFVEIADCPPGFKLENFGCVCNSKEYYGLLECDNDFRSVLTPGLWIGNIPDEETGEIELVTSICPRTFCDYNNTFADKQSLASVIKLPQNHSDLERAICGKRRRGILCGNCAPDYTTHYHSPDFQCKRVDTSCKLGWLLYIITELVPVTVVFITVIVFNISFTSGAVNGFILFSQILLSLNIDASGIIRFPHKTEVTQGYQFLYGFLNLDFFTIDELSFCLWPKATALHMLAFKYITIVYALSLVILVVWFMNRCGGRCLGRWCRITTLKSSVIHGISAFLIICYSQSIMVSHSLLNGVELWRKVNSSLNISKRVWHSGNMTFFREEHLPFAIPALFCLLIIGVLPPMLLLAYPLFNKIMAFFGLEESKFMHFISQTFPVSKIKPLLDTFQGCFKDNLRFFAGLYFMYRWIAPVVNSVTSSLGTAYITYEIFLIVMLALHALFQPYQKRVHNIIDTLLFTNLLLINSITCIHYYLFQSQENRHTVKENVVKTAAVQMTLVYLPLFIIMLYLLVIGCKYVYRLYTKRNGNLSIFSKEMEQPVPVTQTLRRLRAAVRSISSLSGDISVNDEELPHRFIAGEVSYECFEDTDYAREMPSDNKSMQDTVTY